MELHRGKGARLAITTAAILGTLLLQACGGSSEKDENLEPSNPPAPIAAEETREQDSRSFSVDPGKLPLAALADFPNADRWWGVHEGAGYRIEVPQNWNGMLVMWAHGYGGVGPEVLVSNPAIRAHLVKNGYAWAASSYTKNYYDVRAGVEDTNALALAFNAIAEKNGRKLDKPQKIYIVGQSLGGHVAAAAIDQEARETANNKVNYHGAVPMCGVLGDLDLYNYFGASQLAAQKLAGIPATSWPVANWNEILPKVRDSLFVSFPNQTTALGDKYKEVVKNLTGGQRPMFEEGFAGSMNSTVWGTFGRDGTINGILNKDSYDTRNIVYQFDGQAALNEEERAFNATILKLAPHPEANRLRRDGLRWFPKTNAKISVPVVTIHTLGDVYVPFSMEQIYKRRADQEGTSKWLVQRAIRGKAHCDFTLDEQTAAFDAMVNWEQKGIKPEGDEVLDPQVVADSEYGCKFSSPSRGSCKAPN